MKKVLIASKSIGNGIGYEKLTSMFRENGMEPIYKKLQDSGGLLGDLDGMVVGIEEVKGEVFSKAKNLKAVMKFGVGIDNIDTEAAKRYNIKVLNMPGINSDAVAEMAFALMLAVTRRIAECSRKVRAGEWPRLISLSPQGKTLGIVGTGSIGKRLAHMVSGLDMRIIGYDLFPNGEFTEMGGVYTGLEELIKTSDYISLHVPMSRETFHMIGEKELSMMKQTAILINTARGQIIDEKALYEALIKERITGAGLDVLEIEPPEGNPLLKLDNVVCTSHIAAYTRETLTRMDVTCVQKMGEALKQQL
jgi:phosphoglycerate dehydrogenase-like enzyme